MSLSGDTPEGQYAKFLGVAVAVAGVVAFFTVDRRHRWSLPRPLANVLAIVTLVVLYFEFRLDETQLISALGHWLVYLQLIKYFLPKTAEDDWFLFLLGLMQVLIGSVVNQSDGIGAWLFLWAMLAVWVLGQFFLQREARRFSLAQRSPAAREADAPERDPYRGLFDLPYVVATIRVMVTTLALGGLIFLVLPRQPGATRGQTAGAMTKHLTGFDEEVQLGQLGEILENDTVVMTVELSDQDGHVVTSDRGTPVARRHHDPVRRRTMASPDPRNTIGRRLSKFAVATHAVRSTRRSSSSRTTPRPCSPSARFSMRLRLEKLPFHEHERRDPVSDG